MSQNGNPLLSHRDSELPSFLCIPQFDEEHMRIRLALRALQRDPNALRPQSGQTLPIELPQLEPVSLDLIGSLELSPEVGSLHLTEEMTDSRSLPRILVRLPP